MTRPTKQTILTLLGGAAISCVASTFLKSKSARKLAVKTVAGGMKAKDCALKQVESIREEAQDIYEEAKREPVVVGEE